LEAALQKASFLETLKTVLWGLAGIRRRRDHERAPLNPVHLAIIAVGCGVAFVLLLRFVVRLVTAT
jgi:hypothetical protein